MRSSARPDDEHDVDASHASPIGDVPSACLMSRWWRSRCRYLCFSLDSPHPTPTKRGYVDENAGLQLIGVELCLVSRVVIVTLSTVNCHNPDVGGGLGPNIVHDGGDEKITGIPSVGLCQFGIKLQCKILSLHSDPHSSLAPRRPSLPLLPCCSLTNPSILSSWCGRSGGPGTSGLFSVFGSLC